MYGITFSVKEGYVPVRPNDSVWLALIVGSLATTIRFFFAGILQVHAHVSAPLSSIAQITSMLERNYLRLENIELRKMLLLQMCAVEEEENHARSLFTLSASNQFHRIDNTASRHGSLGSDSLSLRNAEHLSSASLWCAGSVAL